MLAPHQIKILSLFEPGKKRLIRYGQVGAEIWQSQKHGKELSRQGLGMKMSAEIRKLKESGFLEFCGGEENRGPGDYFKLTIQGVEFLSSAKESKAMSPEKARILQEKLDTFLAKTSEELQAIEDDPKYDGLFDIIEEMSAAIEAVTEKN